MSTCLRECERKRDINVSDLKKKVNLGDSNRQPQTSRVNLECYPYRPILPGQMRERKTDTEIKLRICLVFTVAIASISYFLSVSFQKKKFQHRTYIEKRSTNKQEFCIYFISFPSCQCQHYWILHTFQSILLHFSYP